MKNIEWNRKQKNNTNAHFIQVLRIDENNLTKYVEKIILLFKNYIIYIYVYIILYLYINTLAYKGNFESFSSYVKSIMYYKNDSLKFSNICYRLYLNYIHRKS